MRISIFAPLLLMLAACATVDTDSASNDRLAFANTRVDFNPISRPERDKLLAYEKRFFETKVAPINKQLAEVEAARTQRYNEIKGEFPDCEKQKHCLSTLTRGNVKQFERYNELTKTLREFDVKTIDLMADQKTWQFRYEIRARSINNRFLVNELLLLPKIEPRITRITIHSLEAFDSRRPLSLRLLRLADFDAVAATWGDLNFQMLGRPVDEAAVIAVYDVWLAPDQSLPNQKADRFVVRFLINVQQADQLGYENGFLKYWASLLVQPNRQSLREQALCGLYSIAGDSLAAKLPSGKASACAAERTRTQTPPTMGSFQYAAEEWILPLGYVLIQNGENR